MGLRNTIFVICHTVFFVNNVFKYMLHFLRIIQNVWYFSSLNHWHETFNNFGAIKYFIITNIHHIRIFNLIRNNKMYFLL